MRLFWLKIGLMVSYLVAGTLSALALDGAMLIVNPGVVTDSLSAKELKDIYTAKTKYWDDGQAIIIVVIPDKTDAALEQASGMDGNQFKTFWERLAFSGRGSEPERAGDTAALVAFVASTKGAIALVPADAALAGVKQIKIK
jgi:ABC-type phosphate transport system substrate-binding protein